MRLPYPPTQPIHPKAATWHPANPYPVPEERLEDGPYYRSKHPLKDRPPHLDYEPCGHPDICTCGGCRPAPEGTPALADPGVLEG